MVATIKNLYNMCRESVTSLGEQTKYLPSNDTFGSSAFG